MSDETDEKFTHILVSEWQLELERRRKRQVYLGTPLFAIMSLSVGAVFGSLLHAGDWWGIGWVVVGTLAALIRWFWAS